MKRVLLILVAVIGFGVCTNAQDIIVLKNGDDIKTIVQEIGLNEIKYKKFENINGPIYTMKKSEIFMIMYENGSKDVFTDVSQPTRVETNYQTIEEFPVGQSLSNPYKFRFYIGTGSGHSYGGVIGGSLEARFNGFALHTGIGFMPDTGEAELGWDVGVKWYFWKNLYVNSIVGTIGSYEEYEYNYWYGYYHYSYPIIGASEMFGVNWSWGGNVRFGINAGIGFCYGFNYDLFSVAYDVGISISFGTK